MTEPVITVDDRAGIDPLTCAGIDPLQMPVPAFNEVGPDDPDVVVVEAPGNDIPPAGAGL